MLRLAVVGNPVFHSKSPFIFNILSKESGIELYYNRISCDFIKDSFDFARELGIDGLNITSPFKKSVIDLVDKLDYQATNLNAANTIIFSDGKTEGYNTDYFGVLKTIWGRNLIFNKKRVLILGAGSAAKTAAFAIRNLNSLLYIWDRNEEKAVKLAEDLGVNSLKTPETESLISSFDFIISTIPPNSKILKELNFTSNQVIFDTVYHNSFFESNKSKFGFELIKGENWLLNQALMAFEYFTSQKPPKVDILDKLIAPNAKRSSVFFLTGFSGSGKSILGKLASMELKCNFIDLDIFIEKKTSLSISEIFSKYGELEFRDLETESLKEIMSKQENKDEITLVSIGAGAMEREENVKFMKSTGEIIWIYSPFETCFSRISTLFNRPMIKDKESAEKLYEERKNSYFLNSDLVFLNTNEIELSVERLVNEIERII